MAPTPRSWNPDWHCEAYGPELDRLEPRAAPHCLFEEIWRCADPAECSDRLYVERRRLLARLLVGAQHGDEVCIAVLMDIEGDPNMLLRATEED